MKKKIRSVCDLLLGLSFLIFTFLGYYKYVNYMSEYCFVSGILIGVIFIISFVYGIWKDKNLPTWLYFDCMISTIIIFIATLAIGLNLQGVFWFIHIINPLLLLCYWGVFCNHLEVRRNLLVLTDVVFPICYFIFAVVLWRTVGNCPFPASLILIDCTVKQTILGVGLVLLIFVVLGYILHFANRILNRKIRQ